MKTRPILFSAPMVRALLAGRKTQTRRIVKPTPDWVGDRGVLSYRGKVGLPHAVCPHGQPMDKLWVRETWCGKVDPITSILMWNEDGNTYQCYYRADGEHVTLDDGDGFTATRKDGSEASPWRPSIFMPRWASRITLEITGVRVERLQDISESDAMAEGIFKLEYRGQTSYADYSLTDEEAETTPMLDSPISSYRTLWQSINGAGSWDANPWVWALTFRRVPA